MSFLIDSNSVAHRNSIRFALIGAVTAVLGLHLQTAQAQDKWYPFSVEVWDPPFKADSPRKDSVYEPLMLAAKKWRICVFFPHLKDAYWLGVNFGIAAEAKRLGIEMDLYEAGGYEHLARQIEQIRQCMNKKPDGLIVAAISATGLNEVVAEARTKSLPVVDLVNGMSSDQISARSAVSFRDMGLKTGQHLVNSAAKLDREVGVAWFPGPKEAAWVTAGDDGFRAALQGSSVKIVTTRFGDTGLQRQESLITEALATIKGIDFIVGTAVTAEAAINVLRKQKLTDKIKVMAYYYSPGVHRGIERGTIVGAPTDQQAIQGRIAIDQVARILEGKPHLRHVGPKIKIVDETSIKNFDSTTSLAPVGFRPIMSVN